MNIRMIDEHEIEKRDLLITNNFNLIHHILQNDFKFKASNANYEDYYQTGCLGLVIAAKKFDFNKDILFSTYAYTIIKNQLLQQLRHKQIPAISLSDTVGNTDILVEETISDEDTNVVKDVEYAELYNAINRLPTLQKEIVLASMQGIKQIDLAKKYKLTQSAISRLYKNAINLLRQMLITI